MQAAVHKMTLNLELLYALENLSLSPERKHLTITHFIASVHAHSVHFDQVTEVCARFDSIPTVNYRPNERCGGFVPP